MSKGQRKTQTGHETVGAGTSQQGNVEIVRQAWAAWLGGDVDGMFASFHPEIVWDMTHFREWPDAIYRGSESVRRFMNEWLEVWDDYEVGLDELRAAPDGRVVCLAWQRGTGRHSGLPMEMEWAQITAVRDGKISRIENYDERSKALEAAGLKG
jgi:ketosteroid isomerase-like protein